MEVVFEKRYEEVMDKLKEINKKHDFWANMYTKLCYERYLEKRGD